jgi:hypothetical protein
MMIAQCQIFVLALDLVNTRENTNIDLFVFWQVIYMSSLFMIAIVLPFGYYFYETEEDKPFKARFCMAFRNTLIVIIILSIIHFPMFASMRHSHIPVEFKAYLNLYEPTTEKAEDILKWEEDIASVFLPIESTAIDLNEELHRVGNATLDMQLTFSAYCIGAGAFWG